MSDVRFIDVGHNEVFTLRIGMADGGYQESLTMGKYLLADREDASLYRAMKRAEASAKARQEGRG